MKLTDEQQKFFDEHRAKQKELHLTEVPSPGEVWSGNASWSKGNKVEIIDFVPDSTSWERGEVTWLSLNSQETFVTGLRTFKTIYASPSEWELSESLMKEMESWSKTSD